MNEVLTSFRQGWEPFDDSPIYTWASRHVKLGNAYSIPGWFNVERSKYLKEPLDALKDLRIRQVAIMASPRCAKTLCAELFLLHSISNGNGGPTLWLQSSDEMIDKMSDLRMLPLLRSCKPVSEMIDKSDRFAITKRKFSFPHMTCNLSSAKIRSLQSIGYKLIIGDEVWLWDEGFISEAQARQIDFQHTSKMLLLSQGGTEGDEWSKEFNKGMIYEWGFKCAACGCEQVLEFNHKREDGTYAGVIWDKNDKTCPNDVWDFREAAKTAKYECKNPQCKHQYTDVPQNRRRMNDDGLYICTNSNGDPKKKSFRWNALANIEIQFGDLCIEYLQAKRALAYEGNKIPFTEFYQKRLAKPFSQTIVGPTMTKILLESYDVGEAWGDYTFMTIDTQNNFTDFPYVIRRWKKNGESRLVKYGRVPTFEELRRIQLENRIPDQCVLIDSGNFATQVYAKCVEYSHVGTVGGRKINLSWIALKGYDGIDFSHNDGTRRLYAPESRGDPNLGKDIQGKTCPLYRWSNYSVKTILVHLRDGKGAKWVANDVDEDYEKQLNSEMLTRTLDKKTNKEKWIFIQKTGVANHYWDCECMQIVAACMVNILGNITTKQ